MTEESNKIVHKQTPKTSSEGANTPAKVKPTVEYIEGMKKNDRRK